MAAGTYYFGWIKSWSNSNSLAFGAHFLTYLLVESESESENSAYTATPTASYGGHGARAVSYTHLTLPTIYSV